MLTQARVVRDASFIGMKAYSRGTHAFTKEDNLHCTDLCKGWSRKIITCQPQPQKKLKEWQNSIITRPTNASIWNMKELLLSKVEVAAKQNEKKIK